MTLFLSNQRNEMDDIIYFRKSGIEEVEDDYFIYEMIFLVESTFTV
jgi:hypothetical protein